MPKSNPSVLDLFCGAGGFALGFERAGFTTVAGIDNDASSLKTFEHNFPGAKTFLDDISNLQTETLKFIKSLKHSIDVIVGGPPCQGFSIAGKRLIDDPRNALYRHYIEIVKLIRPTYLVIENVPNIRTMSNGQICASIISDLENLGYLVKVSTVNASEYGVPQNRKRAFFIAKLRSEPISFPAPKPHFTKLTTSDAISDLPAVDEYFEDSPIPYEAPPQTRYQREMRKGSKLIHNHWSVSHTEKTRSIISLVPDGGNYKDLPKSLQNTRNVNIAWTRMSSSSPSFTIDAGHNHHFHYSANRVPTVRESARIQSFPDKFRFLGSKTSQFRQVGNAVPPKLSEVLALAILKDLQ